MLNAAAAQANRCLLQSRWELMHATAASTKQLQRWVAGTVAAGKEGQVVSFANACYT